MNREPRVAQSHRHVVATLVAAPLLVLMLIYVTDAIVSELAETASFSGRPGRLAAISMTLLFGLLLVGGWAGGRLSGVRPFRSGVRPAAALAFGCAVAIAALLVALAVSFLGNSIALGQGSENIPYIGIGIGLALLQSLSEEVAFRGWMQPVLTTAWGAKAGIVVTASIFALLHLPGAASGGIALFNLFLGGLVFGVLAHRTKAIVASTAFHFTWNASEETLLGLLPNPGAPLFGSVIDLDLVGAEQFGGGAQGLNQSLATTVAFAIVLVAMYAWSRRSAKLSREGPA